MQNKYPDPETESAMSGVSNTTPMNIDPTISHEMLFSERPRTAFTMSRIRRFSVWLRLCLELDFCRCR
uniref:Uncharacterized protein n=1 Tax=Meloidogyne enterolobii TaxID=390850 RepID=A0A6V7YCQ7_MELEN|nr:unnamed protein product [Meloidogyne enterolobii]